MNAPVYREQDRFAEPRERVREAVHSMSAGQDWPFYTHELHTSMDLADGTTLVFHAEVQCLREKHGSKSYFLICPLDIEAEADTTPNARQAAAKKAWDETKRLLHTRRFKLDAAGLSRKGLLLRHVDVVRSGIAKPLGEYSWILGTVERQGSEKPFFLAVGSSGQRFEFAPELENAIPTDGYSRMAKVRTDEIGRAKGPVVELGEPLNDDPEGTWDRWQKLMDGHD